MSPRLKPFANSPQSLGSGFESQIVLRRVRMWFLSLPQDLAESEQYSALWHELRDVERKLFTGTPAGVSDIEAVIQAAISLGYSSRLEQ